MKNAFLIAATGSGCGKTLITCGILESFKRRGLKCRSFKCGPDYIDSMFHKDVLNRSFCSEAYRKADRGNRDVRTCVW